MNLSGRLATIAVVAVLTGVADQASKLLARLLLSGGVQHHLFGGVVTLALAQNPGAFLSLGAGLATATRVALAAAVLALLLALVVVILRNPASSGVSLVAGALLLGGGSSNFVDRLRWDGNVTDFLYLQLGPLHTGIFNIADLAIMVGAILLLWATGRERVA